MCEAIGTISDISRLLIRFSENISFALVQDDDYMITSLYYPIYHKYMMIEAQIQRVIGMRICHINPDKIWLQVELYEATSELYGYCEAYVLINEFAKDLRNTELAIGFVTNMYHSDHFRILPQTLVHKLIA